MTKVQEDIHPTQRPSYSPRSISSMPQSTPKIFLAQGLPSVEPAVPFEEGKPKVTVIKRFNGAELFGGGAGAGSVVGSENGHGNNNTNAGMTPGPASFHPLPSRASANALVEQKQYLGTGNGNGRGVYSHLERAGSTGSLRSQGSYGKFDSSKYVDPAFWGAPSLVPG